MYNSLPFQRNYHQSIILNNQPDVKKKIRGTFSFFKVSQLHTFKVESKLIKLHNPVLNCFSDVYVVVVCAALGSDRVRQSTAGD